MQDIIKNLKEIHQRNGGDAGQVAALMVEALERLPILSIESIAKLELKPGDALVVKCKQMLSPDVRHHISRHLRELFPENKIIVVDGGLELKIVEPQADIPIEVKSGK